VTSDAGPRPRIYTHPLLWMLSAAYACNFMDRSVVGALAQAIKVDLALSDTQIGLLQGFSYVVLYAFVGLPMSRLAERFNRVGIISICLVAWSGMTMLCGAAQGFVQLLLFRVGVGVGEAGCNPCSHSMIADAVAPSERSRALSIYQIGATVGTAAGAVLGGFVAEKLGWRAAFLVVGVPGLIVAAIMWLFAREPVRTAVDTSAQSVDGAKVWRVLLKLLKSRAAVHIAMGFTLVSFAGSGISAFAQPYLVRAYGLSYGQVGLLIGLSGGVASVTSLVLQGRVTDYATRHDVRWHAWLPIIGVTVAVPFAMMIFVTHTWQVSVFCSFCTTFFSSWFTLPSLSALHRILGPRLVATGMALVLMLQNLAGLGGGPYLAGVFIDAFSQHLFSGAGAVSFSQACPGGVARAGAAVLQQSCHAALLGGTRLGLMCIAVFFLWAVLHFALAARPVRRELTQARTGGDIAGPAAANTA
jgi:predicted MFS family arabinose efflux permease